MTVGASAGHGGKPLLVDRSLLPSLVECLDENSWSQGYPSKVNEEVTSEIVDPFGEGIEKFSNVPHLIACFVLGYNYLFFQQFLLSHIANMSCW